jgi:hypothetical protein
MKTAGAGKKKRQGAAIEGGGQRLTNELDELRRLRVPNDAAALSLLSPPEESAVADAAPGELIGLAELYLRQAVALLGGEVTIAQDAVEIPCPHCGERVKFEEGELWDRTLLSLTCYYDFAMRSVIDAGEMTTKGVEPTLGIQIPERLLGRVEDEVKGHSFEQKRTQATLFFVEYHLCLICTYLMDTLRGTPGCDAPLSVLAGMVHEQLCSLHNRERQFASNTLKLMAHRLLHENLHRLESIYKAERDSVNTEHRYGPFSAIRLQELSLLARRDKAVIKKYGTKNVERVFEQQLALIAQSLGFYVVPARSGECGVDLICVSSDQRWTFLLEAKTTAKRYSLPAKDRRALVEYVTMVQTALTTLPRLEFVLIVSWEASKTLGGKLIALEAETGVPARFCCAQDLAELREMSLGPIPTDVFRSEVLEKPKVLPKGFVGEVVRKSQQGQAAHVHFVREMLEVHRPPAGAPAEVWPVNHAR